VDLDVVPRDSAVLFELGDQYAAHHLCQTLWCRWDALIHHGDAATVVAVALLKRRATSATYSTPSRTGSIGATFR
jgi:hypothetical protein